MTHGIMRLESLQGGAGVPRPRSRRGVDGLCAVDLPGVPAALTAHALLSPRGSVVRGFARLSGVPRGIALVRLSSCHWLRGPSDLPTYTLPGSTRTHGPLMRDSGSAMP
jgi:hypothetical protein